jgi:hypothetical protein
MGMRSGCRAHGKNNRVLSKTQDKVESAQEE